MAEKQAVLDVIARAENVVGLVEESVAGAGDDELAFRPHLDDAWTILEHLGHLADMEANLYLRARLCVAEPGKEIMVLDEEKWTATLDYNAGTAVGYLALFRSLRETNIRFFRDHVDTIDWDGAWISHPERGRLSLAKILEICASHGTFHIEYIERNRRLWRELRG